VYFIKTNLQKAGGDASLGDVTRLRLLMTNLLVAKSILLQEYHYIAIPVGCCAADVTKA